MAVKELLHLRPYLEGEGTNKKSNSWKTTSLSRAIMGHHHCNFEKSHLGLTASFIRKQLQKYNIRDYEVISIMFNFRLMRIRHIFPDEIKIFTCRYLSWSAEEDSAMTSEASLKALEAFCSPSAAIT